MFCRKLHTNKMCLASDIYIKLGLWESMLKAGYAINTQTSTVPAQSNEWENRTWHLKACTQWTKGTSNTWLWRLLHSKHTTSWSWDNSNRLGYYWKSKNLEDWIDWLKVDRSNYVRVKELKAQLTKSAGREKSCNWCEDVSNEHFDFAAPTSFAFTFTQRTTPSCIGTRVWLHSFLYIGTWPPTKKKN